MTVGCKIVEQHGRNCVFNYSLRDFDDMKGSLVRFTRPTTFYSCDNPTGMPLFNKKWSKVVKSKTIGMFLDSVHELIYVYAKSPSYLSLSLSVGLLFLIDEQVVSLYIQGPPIYRECLWEAAFDRSGIEQRENLPLTSQEKNMLRKGVTTRAALERQEIYNQFLELRHEIATHLEPIDLEGLIKQDPRWWWPGGFKTSFPDDPNFAFARLMLDHEYDIQLQRKSDGMWSEHKTYTP